jgi:predicted RNase H-like HicB family nuclease
VRRVWYWAILDREGDGFIARIPDLGDLAAYGAVEKDAVAHVAQRAGEHVRALEESGQPVPRPRQASEMPTTLQAKIGRGTSGKAGLAGLVPSIEARCGLPQRRGFGPLVSPPLNAHRPTLRSYGTHDMCCYRPSQHDAATKYLASLV